MSKFTEMTVYMVTYQCFKKDSLIDEYPVGYFVSKEEALSFVEQDIKDCENTEMIQDTYRIIGVDKDPDYRHVYLLKAVYVGRTTSEWNITKMTSWK